MFKKNNQNCHHVVVFVKILLLPVEQKESLSFEPKLKGFILQLV